MPKRTPYLNNADLIEQIHLTKLTVATTHDDDDVDHRHTDFDVILPSHLAYDGDQLERIGRESRSARLVVYHTKLSTGLGIKAEITAQPDMVADIVVRRCLPHKAAFGKGAIPRHFPPFEHIVGANARVVLTVAVQADQPRPRPTDALAKAIMLLCRRMATKGNWRGYSFVDEFVADAVLALLANAVKFNEERNDNVFAYMTAIAHNAFLRRLALERRQHDIRDDLLEIHGVNPSHSRMAEAQHG